MLDRPDESTAHIKELERELEGAKTEIRELNWHTPEEHIRRALAPMFAEFLDVQQQADDAETFAKCDSATARAHSLLNIILHMALDGANDYVAQLRAERDKLKEDIQIGVNVMQDGDNMKPEELITDMVDYFNRVLAGENMNEPDTQAQKGGNDEN